MLAPWKKSYDQPRQHIKKQRHYFANKGLSSQSYDFSSSHVWMWDLDYKESWALKKSCFWTMVFDKTLESPLDRKEIQPVHPKEISPEYLLEGLMLKLKLQYCVHLMWRTEALEKTLILGKIEGRRRRDDRGWDGWMASPTQWTWVWVGSLQPHGLCTKLACPSLSPGVCSNSCPLSQWCHPTISSSVVPSPPAFSLSQHQSFSSESAFHIRCAKYWSFSFSISPSNEYSGLISFRMDWLDLLAVQRTLRVFSSTTIWKH